MINDASSQQIIDEYQNTQNINSIEIINMKENRGHTRCIASGLKYIYEKKEFDYAIPMDGAKMSKSMGNIIPLRTAIKDYGADPIRLAIISSAELLQLLL